MWIYRVDPNRENEYGARLPLAPPTRLPSRKSDPAPPLCTSPAPQVKSSQRRKRKSCSSSRRRRSRRKSRAVAAARRRRRSSGEGCGGGKWVQFLPGFSSYRLSSCVLTAGPRDWDRRGEVDKYRRRAISAPDVCALSPAVFLPSQLSHLVPDPLRNEQVFVEVGEWHRGVGRVARQIRVCEPAMRELGRTLADGRVGNSSIRAHPRIRRRASSSISKLPLRTNDASCSSVLTRRASMR